MSHTDDIVKRWMEQVEKSGELRGAHGQPLQLDDGFEQTPEELRMAHRIMKNAGIVPPEVEQLGELAALRAQVDACTDPAQRRALEQKLAELQTRISLRMERLRGPR